MQRIVIVIAVAAVLLSTCASKSPPAGGEAPFGFEALAAALRARGAQVLPGEAVEQPFFSAAGRFLGVNGEDVQVFEYADGEAARAEAATVSPDGGTIGTAKPFWAAPPHFYRRDRVIVLYTGDAVRVRTPLEAVMGPQFAGR